MAGIDEFLTPEEMKQLVIIRKTGLGEIIQSKINEYNDSLEKSGEPNIPAANYLRYLIKYGKKPSIDLDKLFF